jgi:hypothetical protein
VFGIPSNYIGCGRCRKPIIRLTVHHPHTFGGPVRAVEERRCLQCRASAQDQRTGMKGLGTLIVISTYQHMLDVVS